MPQLFLSHSAGITYSLGSLLILVSSVILLNQNLAAQAQIIPNGAGTLVNNQGNQININGGTQSGANLFHSFRDFNLTPAQVANFLSNPQTQNILARVNGGNPSFINGLLQVTGGNSHLFLMNPAGIVFGQGASLNVPASFTATTANQIGLGNNNLFSAFGNNNFSALTGNPDSFIFNTQAGSIVNAGNLAVGNGQNISLIAGNTINTGRLSAPGGEIQVLAVPGTNRVRLSQPGQVLSLEIVPPIDGTLRAVDLPTLLTGSDLPGIEVNPTGQIQVAGTSLPNQHGIAVASGSIDVSSSVGNGGTVQIMGDRVAVLNSRINANGATGGGTVRLGGEYLGGRDTGIAPEFRFNSQRTLVDRNSLIRANATVTGEGGRVIVWADQNTGYFGRITGRGATGRGGFVEVSGRENLAFDGRVELQGFNGLGGSLLLDPANIIIQAAAGNGDASLPTILGATLPDPMTISAGALGAIAAGTDINITASNSIDFQTNVNLIANGTAPITLIAPTITASVGFPTFFSNGRDVVLQASNINAQNLDIRSIRFGGGNSGNIQATASVGDLRISVLDAQVSNGNGGTITLNAPQGNITVNLIDTISGGGNGGSVSFNAPNGNITIGTIRSQGTGVGNTSGAINVTAGNLVRANGGFTNCSGVSLTSLCSAGLGNANNGVITIRHGGSTTTPFIVGNSTTNGTTGGIDAGAGNIINTTFSVPVPPTTYTQGIVNIITTAPPVVPPVVTPAASPTISPTVLALLQNPAAPATPAPVVVGAPPVSPVVEPAISVTPIVAPVVIPAPQPSPIVITTPIPTPIPSPVVVATPIPISTPISTPSTSLTLSSELRTTLANVDPQDTRLEPEPPSGTLAFITNPSSAEIAARLRTLGNSQNNLPAIQNNLNQTATNTSTRPAQIYVFFTPQNLGTRNEDTLEIILITGRGEPRRVQLSGITRSQVLGALANLRSSNNANETVNLSAARQFYQWLLAPLESELQQQGINNLVFILDGDLRSLPLESLYDGQRFIRERYAISKS